MSGGSVCGLQHCVTLVDVDTTALAMMQYSYTCNVRSIPYHLTCMQQNNGKAEMQLLKHAMLTLRNKSELVSILSSFRRMLGQNVSSSSPLTSCHRLHSSGQLPLPMTLSTLCPRRPRTGSAARRRFSPNRRRLHSMDASIRALVRRRRPPEAL